MTAEEMPRTALFISHAAPEDNPFTLWLGAKLAALGYEVFADILRLRGGDDWERILESAIRGMLPKTKMGRAMVKKLKVYSGPEHPHKAQRPEPLEMR